MGDLWSYARRRSQNQQNTLRQVYNAWRSVSFLDNWSSGGSSYSMPVRSRWAKSNRERRGEVNQKFMSKSWKPMDGLVSVEKGSYPFAWQQITSNQETRSNWALTDEKPWTCPDKRQANGGDDGIFPKVVWKGLKGMQRACSLHFPSHSMKTGKQEHTIVHRLKFVSCIPRTPVKRLMDERTGLVKRFVWSHPKV